MTDEEKAFFTDMIALLSTKLDAIIERLPPPPRRPEPLPPARLVSDEEHARLQDAQRRREGPQLY